jgi:hypothetical protein
MTRPAAFPRPVQPDTGRSVASERSREVDALLDDLDIVLGCRCCAPRAFIIDDWAADEDKPADPSRLL